MFEIRSTEVYKDWIAKLRDKVARVRIGARVDQLEFGNPGDARNVGGTVMELRFHFGPGYRVYYTRKGELVILLLCGGDKITQSRDIQRAKALASQIQEEE